MLKRVIISLALCLQWPAHSSEVVIYSGDNYAPIIYLDQQHQPQGVLAQAIQNYQQFSGKKIKFEVTAWHRAYQYALNGKGGVIGLSKTTPRLALFDYSDVIYENSVNLVVRRGKEFNYRTLSDLKDKVIGVDLGASYGNEVDTAIQQKLFKVDISTSNTARLKKLLHGRSDAAVVTNGQVGLDAILQADPELLAHKNEFVTLPVPLVRDALHLGFAKSMQMSGFLSEFNQSLKANKTPFSIKTD